MAFFMRRSASHADAEDLTQDVFAKLAAAARGMDNPDAYIFQMAANLLRDRQRRERVRTTLQPELADRAQLETEMLDPARVLLGREALQRLGGWLSELPDRTRTIFLLFRIEGISQAELASTYDISTRAVQKHILKAVTHILAKVEVSR